MKRMTSLACVLYALSFAFPIQGQQEVAVTNGGSFETVPLSPGCWATAFGDFASVGVMNTVADSVPFPDLLGGVQVFVNDVAAPMNFVGGTQINFLVPKSAPTEGKATLRIAVAGNTTYEGTINMWPASPGLLFVPTDPTRPGRVLNQDNTENSAQNPAQRGQIVQIFGVGADFSELPSDDGDLAPADRLIPTTRTPRAYVSTIEAEVQFSGLAPGLVNAWQLNLIVPDEPFISGQVPVVAEIGGFKTNLVSIWIAP